MDREHFYVNGIANESTKTSIKNSLENLDGVSKVCVDMGRSSIEVMFNPPATKSEIENCIVSTGQKLQ